MSDGSDESEGQVTIEVTPVNDPPVANDDVYGVVLGDTLDLSGKNGVLANDQDVEGDSLVVVAVVSGAGAIEIGSDGALRFEPPDVGVYVAGYTVEDGSGAGDTAIVTVTVSGSAPAIAGLICAPSPVATGSAVVCSAQVTGVVVQQLWSAPGGSPAAGSGASFSTTFDAAGSKVIELQVCNGAGCDQASAAVVVVDPPPTVSLQSDAPTLSAFGGFGTITATVLGGDGSPLAGVSVSFTTTIGFFQNQSDAIVVVTDANGRAVVQLFGDGTLGPAAIIAQLGGDALSAQVSVAFTL